MVNLFGRKRKGEKKKGKETPADQSKPSGRIDQNLLGEGQYFGSHARGPAHDGNSVRSDPPRTSKVPAQRKSIYTHETHNFTAASMFDLSQMKHHRQSSISSAPGSSAASARYPASRASTTKTSVTAPTPPFLFASRPNTPNGTKKPWVNPLDVHFSRTTPTEPPQTASPRVSPPLPQVLENEHDNPRSKSSAGEKRPLTAGRPLSQAKIRQNTYPQPLRTPTYPLTANPVMDRADSPPILAAFPSPPRSAGDPKLEHSAEPLRQDFALAAFEWAEGSSLGPFEVPKEAVEELSTMEPIQTPMSGILKEHRRQGSSPKSVREVKDRPSSPRSTHAIPSRPVTPVESKENRPRSRSSPPKEVKIQSLDVPAPVSEPLKRSRAASILSIGKSSGDKSPPKEGKEKRPRARLSKAPPAAKASKAKAADAAPAIPPIPSPPRSLPNSSESLHTNAWSGKGGPPSSRPSSRPVSRAGPGARTAALPSAQLPQASYSDNLLDEIEKSLAAAHAVRDRSDAASIASSHYSERYRGPPPEDLSQRPMSTFQQQTQPVRNPQLQGFDLRQPRPAFANGARSRHTRSQSPILSRPSIGASDYSLDPTLASYMGPPSGPRNSSPFRGRQQQIVPRLPPILRPKSERFTPSPSRPDLDPSVPPVPSLAGSPFLRPAENHRHRDVSSVRSLNTKASGISRDNSRAPSRVQSVAMDADDDSDHEVLMKKWETSPAMPAPAGPKSPLTPDSAPGSTSPPTLRVDGLEAQQKSEQDAHETNGSSSGLSAIDAPSRLTVGAMPPSPVSPNWPFPSLRSTLASRSPRLLPTFSAKLQSKRSPPPAPLVLSPDIVNLTGWAQLPLPHPTTPGGIQTGAQSANTGDGRPQTAGAAFARQPSTQGQHYSALPRFATAPTALGLNFASVSIPGSPSSFDNPRPSPPVPSRSLSRGPLSPVPSRSLSRGPLSPFPSRSSSRGPASPSLKQSPASPIALSPYHPFSVSTPTTDQFQLSRPSHILHKADSTPIMRDRFVFDRRTAVGAEGRISDFVIGGDGVERRRPDAGLNSPTGITDPLGIGFI
jgi:hypothetical protein